MPVTLIATYIFDLRSNLCWYDCIHRLHNITHMRARTCTHTHTCTLLCGVNIWANLFLYVVLSSFGFCTGEVILSCYCNCYDSLVYVIRLIAIRSQIKLYRNSVLVEYHIVLPRFYLFIYLFYKFLCVNLFWGKMLCHKLFNKSYSPVEAWIISSGMWWHVTGLASYVLKEHYGLIFQDW